MLISTIYDLLLYGAAVQQGNVTPSVQVPGDLPQVGGGSRGPLQAEPLYSPIPLFTPTRRVTSKVIPPPPEEETEAPPEEEGMPSAPVYPFTDADFQREIPSSETPIRKPRIVKARFAFEIPIPSFTATPTVLVHASASFQIPTMQFKADAVRRYRDDAIPLAQERPELGEIFEEWIVG